MSEINYQEGHETAGQAKPVAWRYRYVKKGIEERPLRGTNPNRPDGGRCLHSLRT